MMNRCSPTPSHIGFFAQQTGSSYGFIFENADAALLFKGLPPTDNDDGKPETRNYFPYKRSPPWLPLPVTPAEEARHISSIVPYDGLSFFGCSACLVEHCLEATRPT